MTVSPRTGPTRPAARLFLLFALALVFRLALVALRYTPDFSQFDSGDYILYRLGAEHFLQTGDFTNSLFLPRPPLFPVLIAALGVNTLAVLVVNCVLGAMIAPATYGLARAAGMSERLALVAGAIMTVEPSGLVYSAFLGAEPLANLLLTLALLVLLKAVQAGSQQRAVALAVGAGLLLVLATYARPASYLLWVGVGAWLLWAYRKRWLAVVIFIAISLAGVGAWIVHNGQVFGHYTFSTVGPYTLVYYHAASVERLATGDDMDAIYTRINQRMEALLGRDPAAADAGTMHHYLASTPPISDALNQVALEIMRAHPLHTLITLPIGFVRMYGLMPDRVALLRNQLPWALLEIAWNGVLLAGTGLGLWAALRQRLWPLFWLPLLTGAYFTAGVLIVKSVGDVRERSMLLPLMVMLTVYAGDFLLRRRRATSGQPAARPAQV